MTIQSRTSRGDAEQSPSHVEPSLNPDVQFRRMLSQVGEVGEIAREIDAIETKMDAMITRLDRFLKK